MNGNETGSVYIEGSDLVGKDVVGEIIKGRYGIANVQKLALHSENPWNADKTGELPSGHPLFPAFLIRSIIWDIQHYRPGEEQDRLQISFTASRSAAWTQASGSELAGIYSELLHFSPLFKNTFLLSADIEVKRERLKRRAMDGGLATKIDSLVFTKPDFVALMDERLKELVTREMGGVVVDTSSLSIKQVGEILIASIEGNQVLIKRADRRVEQFDITPELSRFRRELLRFSRKTVNQYALPESYYDKLAASI